MSEHEQENLEPQEQDPRDDELRDEQEGKGYGEDEGERDESFPSR
jgi:hypothetical protein